MLKKWNFFNVFSQKKREKREKKGKKKLIGVFLLFGATESQKKDWDEGCR